MPLLDVTSILTDPDFASVFSVVRRTEVVSVSSGLTSISEVTTPDVLGVITIAKPSQLVRDDVGQMMGRTISVITKHALRGASVGVQPDQVIWNGIAYTVTVADPYLHFGAGFVQAEATSMKTSTP